jgi:opacity protein-like surface antigen
MRFRSALVAASILGLPVCALPVSAVAQPIQGLYVSGGGGGVINQAIRAAKPASAGANSTFEENLGFDVTGSVGYALGDGWRFELEGDYLRSGIHELHEAEPLTASGHVRTYGLMANALYDFDISSRYVFPYLGVGAGYMWTRLDNASFLAPGSGPGSVSFGSTTSSGSFAVQLIAGLSFPVPNMPGLSLLTQYRFLDVTSGQNFSGEGVTATGTVPSSVKLGPQFSHTFLIGIRYAFHVTPPVAAAPPAPPPVAAPAPAPARSYLVFFDWDSAALTDRAREIIRSAAEASTHVQTTRIRVNGYTDTSGKPGYNMKLSLRRAQNVAAELVRDGVSENEIAIRGFGETHLLVPTGPGVREPQNRRVEIIIG